MIDLNMIKRPRIPIWIPLVIALLLGGLWGIMGGSVFLGPRDIYRALLFFLHGEGDGTVSLILFDIRLPRIFLAMAVGASLAVSGAAFQGFFRNSLADPYVIGASSGAALGAALAIVTGFRVPALVSAAGISPAALCAFAGSLAAVFLAFTISRSAGNPPPAAALLLAGTSLGAFFSALLSLILVLKDRDLHRVYYWLLGSLGNSSWAELSAALPVMAAGSLIIFLSGRPLDLLLQGEEEAESLGVDVKKARIIIALGASLATAAAVASAGIIGFVGLIAPHGVRMFTGPSHKRLLPAAALAGALLVLLADILARSALPPLELPIGIICSLAGAPFFIFLLVRLGGRPGRFI
ncbi:MAG: iron ABC transporter permease [Treponema sp.]|jgi:iron complex transport system permease protein|nr:iron ABC transporter permease [Treponema sp.]